MKKIPVINRYGSLTEYTIYETEQEVLDAGRQIKTIYDAEKLDCVLCIQGYYIPCIKVSRFTKRDGSSWLIKYFPAKRYIIYPNEDIWFSYDVESRERYFIDIPLWTQKWCHFVAAGYHPYDAIVKAIVPEQGRIYKFKQIIVNLVRDKRVMYYLWNCTDMANLRDELVKKNITLSTVADHIEGILNNPKAPANLKQWALNQVVNTYEKKPGYTPTPPMGLPPQDGSGISKSLSSAEEYKLKLLQERGDTYAESEQSFNDSGRADNSPHSGSASDSQDYDSASWGNSM